MKTMPLMGFGTFIGIEHKKIDSKSERDDAVADAIFEAFKVGIRHFDLAENYGNLSAVGRGIQRAMLPTEKGGLGLKREDFWLTLKIMPPFIEPHLNSLLKTVGVDYFDLCLIHFPQPLFESCETLVAHWQALCELKCKDLIKEVGVSNFYPEHLKRLLAISAKLKLDKPFANEIESNPWSQNNAVIKYCQDRGIKTIAYSPLGYAYSEMILEDPVLNKIAEKHHATPAQIALAWQMARQVAVIPKSTQSKRIMENTQAASIQLAEDELREIERITVEFDASFMTTLDAKQHASHIEWELPSDLSFLSNMNFKPATNQTKKPKDVYLL